MKMSEDELKQICDCLDDAQRIDLINILVNFVYNNKDGCETKTSLQTIQVNKER